MENKYLDPSEYATFKCGGNNLYGWYELSIDDMHKLENEIYKLEKALELAIKDIVSNLHGSDACNNLDDSYYGVREFILNKANEELEGSD